jgi:hypothetical protein
MTYHKDDGTDVSDYVKNGSTEFTNSLIQALKIAKQRGTYHYPINVKDEKGKIIDNGYGIPK